IHIAAAMAMEERERRRETKAKGRYCQYDPIHHGVGCESTAPRCESDLLIDLAVSNL
ncbi:Hypothetical predicted protein, partial [Olea europaea subsp. europaea]